MTTCISLTNTLFTEPPAGHWYNLSTNRVITKIPKTCSDMVLHDKPRVAGTPAQIARFLALQTGQLIAGPSSLSLQYQDNDVASLTQDHLDVIPRFTLVGLTTKARVVKIIDGDTLDLVFYVSLEKLLVLKIDAVGGFFTRWVTRISEYDAAESKTERGIIAKMMMCEKMLQLNNIVYIRVIKFEPHGRILADVYEDPEYTKHIKHYFLDYTHPSLGKIAVPYDGGKRIKWTETSGTN